MGFQTAPGGRQRGCGRRNGRSKRLRLVGAQVHEAPFDTGVGRRGAEPDQRQSDQDLYRQSLGAEQVPDGDEDGQMPEIHRRRSCRGR